MSESSTATDLDRPTGGDFDALHTEHGDTTIADTVVEKIAILAAREVSGVYAMGNAARRAIGNLTGRISHQSVSSGGGVSIQKTDREATATVSVVVEYGVAIVDVSESIRQNIIRAVEYGTGLHVTSVDVNVSDVHLPEEDDTAPDLKPADFNPADNAVGVPSGGGPSSTSATDLN